MFPEYLGRNDPIYETPVLLNETVITPKNMHIARESTNVLPNCSNEANSAKNHDMSTLDPVHVIS